jgi:hypothetical protein
MGYSQSPGWSNFPTNDWNFKDKAAQFYAKQLNLKKLSVIYYR